MYGAKEEQLRVVYNGIDHMRFVPLEKPKELQEDESKCSAFTYQE